MTDQEPVHELPSKSGIEFLLPSEETHRALDFGLRWGGFKRPLPLAQVELPEAYPASKVEVVFDGGKYETPNEDPDVPKWVSYYSIDVNARLREPRSFSEEEARRIVMALQANAGRGEYRRLASGVQQITVPGKDMMKPYDPRENHYTRHPHHIPVAVMSLGVSNPEEAIEQLAFKRDNAFLASDYKRYDQRIGELREGKGVVIDSLTIELVSHYLGSEGGNMDLKGKLDRRFAIDPLHPMDVRHYHPFDEASDYFGVYSEHFMPFFRNAGYMLQAVSDSLGYKDLPRVEVPIEMPSSEQLSSWHAEQSIPQHFRDFLGELGFQ